MLDMDFRTVRARALRPTERQKKAAANLQAGMPIKAAMLDAGYSEAVANNGMRKVPMTVQALGIKGTDVYQAGKGMSIEDLKHLAIGRLVLNVTEGKDGGVMSAKTLGSHRELNLWTPESQIGLMVVNAPDSGVKAKADVPEDEK